MKTKTIFLLMILSITVLTGCGNLSPSDNLSPQVRQQIDNANGKINGLENNQNSIKVELARITQDIGQIRDFQQGIGNFQSNNNGIQILQGSGPMILFFGLGTIGMLLYYFYKSKTNEKIVDILQQQIKLYEDVDLEENIMVAAMYTDVEKEVYNLMID